MKQLSRAASPPPACAPVRVRPAAETIGTVAPGTDLVQLIGPEQLNWEQGQIELKYALRVTNRAAEPITLRQIQIQTVGQDGPYSLQSSYFFREAIAPGTTRSVDFFVKALSEGDRYRIDAQSADLGPRHRFLRSTEGKLPATVLSPISGSRSEDNND